MIVPMKHVTVLCLESEKNKALLKLSEAGVLHVNIGISDSEQIIKSSQEVDYVKRAIASIKLVLKTKEEDVLKIEFPSAIPNAIAIEDSVPASASIVLANTMADDYLASIAEKQRLDQIIAKYLPFGDFNPESASELIEKGVNVRLFVASPKMDVDSIKTDSVCNILSKTSDGIYGVLIGNEALPEGLSEIPMPTESLARTIERSEACVGRISLIIEKLTNLKRHLHEIEADLIKRIQESESVIVSENMLKLGEGVVYLTGFIPARRNDLIVGVAKQNGWGIVVRNPEEGELVPTLLEPPKLFRPITKLFGMLGILPAYNETDVSVPFFIFFSIFFAMLIGDAGYGLVILLLALFANHKLFKSGKLTPYVKSVLSLMYVFSGTTILYGVLSGTYFGVPQTVLPEFLKFKSVTWLGNQDNIMQLCLSIGALHLIIARAWNAVMLYPSKKLLAEVGWCGIVISMYCLVCGIIIQGFTTPSWNTTLLIVSALLILFFMLDRSELKENGVSLGMLPLNIISCMGDIISYIRLFAVGLASVKVAENFNLIAADLEMSLIFKIPIMVIILLLGHGVNFIMGALSVLVHAVRLNTLEFSSAKGVSWSGIPYKPYHVDKNK
ncbi:MAG: hypothetical protein J6V41_07075 [Kiritimatiellae bacterium]|nr:hypothetical protein [Kiritimatiellia bacterium]